MIAIGDLVYLLLMVWSRWMGAEPSPAIAPLRPAAVSARPQRPVDNILALVLLPGLG
jgi:hypothetical protein